MVCKSNKNQKLFCIHSFDLKSHFFSVRLLRMIKMEFIAVLMSFFLSLSLFPYFNELSIFVQATKIYAKINDATTNA